jgi:predicted GIY-YIG superfamily endonuclease
MSRIYKLTCKTCKMSYIGQTSKNLNQRYRKHTRYIKKNYPQSAYAQHILQNLYKYGSITDAMSLLKPIHKMSMLISYEQLFIQTFHHNGNLITEQGTGEQNPLFQLVIDTMLTSATT